jgi:hypothetical protein
VLDRQIGAHIFDLVICNQKIQALPPNGVQWVLMNPLQEIGYPIYQADLVDEKNPIRHDSIKLAKTIMDLYFERTGPLSNKEDSSSL